MTEYETSFIEKSNSCESPLLQHYASRHKKQREKYHRARKIGNRSAYDNVIACEACESPFLTQSQQGGEITTSVFRNNGTEMEMEKSGKNHINPEKVTESPSGFPWNPQNNLFTQEEDEHFQESVKFATRYVKNLSGFVNRIDHERIKEEEWKMLAKIVNRFFLVVTIIVFGVTAIIGYLLYNIKS